MVSKLPKALADFLGYIIFFWSNEESKPHVRVCKGRPSKNASKFWVSPGGVMLEHNGGDIPAKDLRKIEAYLVANREQILIAWMEHFEE